MSRSVTLPVKPTRREISLSVGSRLLIPFSYFALISPYGYSGNKEVVQIGDKVSSSSKKHL